MLIFFSDMFICKMLEVVLFVSRHSLSFFFHEITTCRGLKFRILRLPLIIATQGNSAPRALIGWLGSEKQVPFTSQQPMRPNRASRVKSKTISCKKKLNLIFNICIFFSCIAIMCCGLN